MGSQIKNREEKDENLDINIVIKQINVKCKTKKKTLNFLQNKSLKDNVKILLKQNQTTTTTETHMEIWK